MQFHSSPVSISFVHVIPPLVSISFVSTFFSLIHGNHFILTGHFIPLWYLIHSCHILDFIPSWQPLHLLSFQGPGHISKKRKCAFLQINKIAEKIGMVLTAGDNIRVLFSGSRAHFPKWKCMLLAGKSGDGAHCW